VNNLETKTQKINQSEENFNLEEIKEIYHKPLIELIHQAAEVHRNHFDPKAIQLCSLLSIKTGGCPENCSYCSQSAHHKTSLKPEDLKSMDEVLDMAKNAKQNGASRFCMGAAWRQVKDNDDFDSVLEMIRNIRKENLESCVSLGMVTEEQALKLKEAGLTSYNHNLDTGSKYYDKVVTTRTYEDRLHTLKNIQKAGIKVCCGAIIGMGESDEDRVEFIYTISNLEQPPESIPVNALVPIKGTGLENQNPVLIWDVIRMIAALRIFLPTSIVRLSAGRANFSHAEQALCFLAGANSIFLGDKLLTTPNIAETDDHDMLKILGISGDKAVSLNQ